MLARITTATAHLVDVCFESSSLSTQENEDGESSLIVDLQALRCLLPSPTDNIWGRVAACGRVVVPLYENLQQVLSSDFENVTQVLLDLESRNEQSVQNLLPVGLLNEGEQAVQTESNNKILYHRLCMTERPPRKRRRSSQSTLPIVIPSTHPSTPTIVVTLAPLRSRETSCCIPYQNQAFGNLLPVPCHPVFNTSHTPKPLDSCILPFLDTWEWKNERWEAILPSLEEQYRRNMFSRPISSKRKSCRKPVCTGIQGRRCR